MHSFLAKLRTCVVLSAHDQPRKCAWKTKLVKLGNCFLTCHRSMFSKSRNDHVYLLLTGYLRIRTLLLPPLPAHLAFGIFGVHSDCGLARRI